MDLRDSELSPLSASDSDSSLGSHVSPSLSAANKDSGVKNESDVNVSGNSTGNNNMVMTNSNSQSSNSNSNQGSICNNSNVTSDAPSGSAGGGAGSADVTVAASILGKRAISDVDASTDGGTTSGGSVLAPKKGSGKSASRLKKAALSEPVRKMSGSSSHARFHTNLCHVHFSVLEC